MRRGLKESRSSPFPACQAAAWAVSKQTPENNLELKVTESLPSFTPIQGLISHPPLSEEDMKSAKHHQRLFGGPRMLQRRELFVDAFLGYTMEIQHTLPRSSGLSVTSNM